MYEYKMVQVPPAINVGVKEKGNEAAAYLQSVVNENSIDGWEFYRVDSIGIEVSPGCFGGNKNILKNYYVVSFRKAK